MDDINKDLESCSQELYELAVALISLQALDIAIQDQSGSGAIVTLFNLAMERGRIFSRFHTKTQYLESSCMTFDTKSSSVKLYNSRPDFICQGGGYETHAVGEVESSPYTRMVVASLGHMGIPTKRYLLGVTLSKSRTVELYWIEKQLGVKIFSGTEYFGPVGIRKLTTSPLDLTNADNLHRLLTMVVKAVIYMETEHEKIMSSNVPFALPDDIVPVKRKSGRKRKSGKSSSSSSSEPN